MIEYFVEIGVNLLKGFIKIGCKLLYGIFVGMMCVLIGGRRWVIGFLLMCVCEIVVML